MPNGFSSLFKRFSPRSFMGRATLMIVLPVLVLQISMSILIVQRYFNFVTKQLTEGVIANIQFFEASATDLSQFTENLAYFDYKIDHKKLVDRNHFNVFDLSGHYIFESFEESYSLDTRIDSRDGEIIFVSLPTRFGDLTFRIPRSKLAPKNPHQILINTVLFTSIVLAVALLFLKNQVRSIRALARAAEGFGRGEVVDYQPGGAREIRLAGRIFLNMRARIIRQREQRGLLLSGISHDLRTPITRMRLNVEMIDNEKTKTELIQDLSDLDKLTESFLDYASGSAKEPPKTVNLRELILGMKGDIDGVDVGDIPNIELNLRPVLFERAISNVIGNAKRFAETVNMQFEIHSRSVQIVVDDDGPGIAKKDRESAVAAFRKLDQSRNQDEGAHAGLGLAIVADAIAQNGGELKLEDAPIGGLRVIIELPLLKRQKKPVPS